jgi:hypothetical protein
MAETITLLNGDGELTIQTKDSTTEWITADANTIMEIKQ